MSLTKIVPVNKVFRFFKWIFDWKLIGNCTTIDLIFIKIGLDFLWLLHLVAELPSEITQKVMGNFCHLFVVY